MWTPSTILPRVTDNSQLSSAVSRRHVGAEEAANLFSRPGRCCVTVPAGHTICTALARLTGAPIIERNRLGLLQDGGTYFPAILSAVQNARCTISVQMYRFHGGEIATRFAHAFAERARSGVQVRILLDDYGTGRMNGDLQGLLASAGVEVRIYNPLRLRNLRRLNQRNHRKLIVIDRSEAFVTGLNLDDVFMGSIDRRAWRENAVCVRGPLAREIDDSVRAAWSGRGRTGGVSARSLERGDAFNASDGQLLLSDHEQSTFRIAYLHVIRSAARSVHISTAYLVPEPDLADALVHAAQRGVDVRLLTTGAHNNIALARIGSHATYGVLLHGGVRIFEYRPAMLHAKSIIVDGKWSALGSPNLDAFGFRYNLESMLATCDAAFVEELQQSYLADTQEADEITFDDWCRRPLARRVGDIFVRPLRYLL